MPPRYLRKASSTPLKPCSEFTVEACDIAPADQCCGVLPCTLCLEWEVYGEDTAYGSASFTGSTWEGSVGGLSFVSYWERLPTGDIILPVSNNSVGMSFTGVSAGTYTMGSPVSEPGRDADETEVSTTVQAFVIGTTEVTQAQWALVFGAISTSPSHFIGPNRPVEMVSYEDAQAFCQELSSFPAEIAMGRSYRLPTEAEWEYACRAGTTTAYSFGANPLDLPTYGWFTDNSGAETHDVGGKPDNAWGLLDMHGNVWEWTGNSRLDGAANDQVIRGGGWNSTAAECRSASRQLITKTTRRNDIGFRIVMERSPIPQFGECEYVVMVNGEEVLRETCYEGASCRYPGGSVGVTVGYDSGTLTWTKRDPRPLPLIVNPDTGCNDFFCGDCRCTCRALCVEVSEVLFYNGIAYATDTYSGELGDTAYSDCDPPVWSGTIGSFTIRLALDRDDYGNCIVRVTANGEETTALVTGCDNISGTVELYDGSSFTFRCKDCNQCAKVIGPCICSRPMGETLRVVWASGNGTHGSASRTFDLTYGMQDEPTITCAPWSPGPFPGYRGSVSGTFPLPMGGTRGDTLEVILVCECIGCEFCIYHRWVNDDEYPTWQQHNYTVITCDCPAILDAIEGFITGNTWGYQVGDVLIYELESNC